MQVRLFVLVAKKSHQGVLIAAVPRGRSSNPSQMATCNELCQP